jgi:hypothetical protein
MMASCIVTIFVDLYPNVMVSRTSAAFSLTVRNTASGNYSLKVMTVVVIDFLPLVIGYQSWTYYVFRRRVSDQQFRPPPPVAEPPVAGPPWLNRRWQSAPTAVSPRRRGPRRERPGGRPSGPGGPGAGDAGLTARIAYISR